MATFDPYYEWLGIPPPDQPPHHYRLLGLNVYEANAGVIENAAEQRMLLLKNRQAGNRGEITQKLLNEVSAAQGTLLDAEKKAAYDAQLRRKLEAANPKPQATPSAAVLQVAAKLQAAPKPPPQPAPAPAAASAPLVMKPAKSSGQAALRQLKQSNRNMQLLLCGVLVVVIALVGIVAFTTRSTLSNDVAEAPRNTQPGPPPPPLPKNTPEAAPSKPEAPEKPAVVPAPPAVAPKKPLVEKPAGKVVGDNIPANEPNNAPLSLDSPLGELDPIDPNMSPPLPGEVPMRRAPPPEAAALTQARAALKEVFKQELAKARTLEEKDALAALLQKVAREETPGSATQYAALDMARELSSAAGNLDTAGSAINELAIAFEVNANSLRQQSLAAAVRASVSPEMRRNIVLAGIQLSDEFLARDDYVNAGKALTEIGDLARGLKDKDLNLQLADRRKQGSELYAEFKQVQSLTEKLKVEPNNQEANLALGKFLCFAKQDWDQGLAHLAAGGDAKLAALAQQDLAFPTEVKDQIAVADGWSLLATASTGKTKQALQNRAALWYREALSLATGLEKAKVEKRLESLPQPQGQLSFVQQVYLDDLTEEASSVGHGVLGKHGVNGYHSPVVNKVRVGGQTFEHSLTMSPPANGQSHAVYNLKGQYRQFFAVAGFLDGCERADTAVTFKVFGDNTLLWQSKPIQVHGESDSCDVSVVGVKKLKLVIACPGKRNCAASVWLNPTLSLAAGSGSTPRGGAQVPNTAPAVVYLDDLQEISSDVAYGELGKRGATGFPADDIYQRVTYRKQPIAHALSMVPHARGEANITCDLRGEHDTFSATAGFMDHHGHPISSATFRVLGDGQELWRSSPMKEKLAAEKCLVSVRGVKMLKLVVSCTGVQDYLVAVWMEPKVTPAVKPVKPAEASRVTNGPPAPVATFTAGGESKGLELARHGDGEFELVKSPTGDHVRLQASYLYFRIDDAVAHDLPLNGTDRYALSVRFRDVAKGSFLVEYDAHRTGERLEQAYTGSRSVSLKGTGEWRTELIELPKPRFANVQNASADFRIDPHGLKLEVSHVGLFRVSNP